MLEWKSGVSLCNAIFLDLYHTLEDKIFILDKRKIYLLWIKSNIIIDYLQIFDGNVSKTESSFSRQAHHGKWEWSDHSHAECLSFLSVVKGSLWRFLTKWPHQVWLRKHCQQWEQLIRKESTWSCLMSDFFLDTGDPIFVIPPGHSSSLFWRKQDDSTPETGCCDGDLLLSSAHSWRKCNLFISIVLQELSHKFVHISDYRIKVEYLIRHFLTLKLSIILINITNSFKQVNTYLMTQSNFHNLLISENIYPKSEGFFWKRNSSQ